MKTRFNKFEKMAGAFVGVAMVASFVAMGAVALKNGWFASKIPFTTELESADGVHSGTVVQIAGLRVGSVTDVDLGADDHVTVHIQVFEKFRDKVRADSHIQMFRPFILSDKVLEISTGSPDRELLAPEATIPTIASTDVMDLLSGKKMTAVLSSFDNLADSLRIIGGAFAGKERARALVQMLDRLNPLVNNLSVMASEVGRFTSVANRDKRAETLIANLTLVSEQLGRVLPAINEESPNVGHQLGQIVNNMTVVSGELKKFAPAVAVLAPDLPRTSHRAVEALDEMVVLLKAMEKSFLLRGNVREVHEEESRRPAADLAH